MVCTMTSWKRNASRDKGNSPEKFERLIFNRICSMVRKITSAFGFFKNKRTRRPRKSKKTRKSKSKKIDVNDDFIYELFADIGCALIFIYVSANLVLLVLLRTCIKPILYAVGEKIQVKCCFFIIAALILLSILASSL